MFRFQDVLFHKFFNMSFRWRLSFALDIAKVGKTRLLGKTNKYYYN